MTTNVNPESQISAWHFTVGPKLRDGRPLPAIGEWLIHEGPVEICESGLHASQDVLDALRYVPGTLMHRVTCEQLVDEHQDKFVCRRRRIDATVDARQILVQWSHECAELARWFAAGARAGSAAGAAVRCAAFAARAAFAAAAAGYAATEAAETARSAADHHADVGQCAASAARKCMSARLVALFERSGHNDGR